MNYLRVYDKKATSFTGMGLAVLEKATNVKIKEVINGEFTLSFVLPRNDPKWQYVKEENYIKCFDASQKKDQLFRVRTFKETRDKAGKITSNVQCEHCYYDAQSCKHIPAFEMIGATPRVILEAAFSGTRFTIGTVEITALTDILGMSKTNPAQITSKLIDQLGGELVKDDYTINLVAKRGKRKSFRFTVGKNLQEISRDTDSRDLITRLYAYGKDDMPLDSVSGYIDSPLINNYESPRVGYKDYKDIESTDELMTAALAEWSTSEKDGCDKPRITYAAKVLELKKLKDYGDIEAFGLGDDGQIIDSELGIDTNQRIVEYEFYPYEAQQSNIVFANYDVKVYRQNTDGGFLTSLYNTTTAFNEVTNATGELNPQWFENIKAKLSTVFNGGLRKAVMHKTGDIWVDNPDNPTKAMGILADGFAIANSKTASGDWNWKTFGTADGFVADVIIGGLLKGVTIEVDTDAKIGNMLTVGADDALEKEISLYNSGTSHCRIRLDADEILHIETFGDMDIVCQALLQIVGSDVLVGASTGNLILNAGGGVNIGAAGGNVNISAGGDVNLPVDTKCRVGGELVATRDWVIGLLS